MIAGEITAAAFAEIDERREAAASRFLWVRMLGKVDPQTLLARVREALINFRMLLASQ